MEPQEVISEDDIQGTKYKSILNINIYIYSGIKVKKYVSPFNLNSNLIFGKIPMNQSKIKRGNLNRQMEKGNDPVSIGTYEIFDENKIEMQWHFHETTEIVFKGEILLDGDAIKGTFYKNGEVNVSERVYYNIDKSLPDNLIEETEEM